MSGRAKFWVVVIAIGFACMAAWNSHLEGAEKQRAEDFQRLIAAKLDTIEQSSDTPAQKSKQIIETAFLDKGALDIINKRYPDHQVRQRVIEHIRLGYQTTDPVSSLSFEHLADLDCAGRALDVIFKPAQTEQDVYEGWQLAKSDLQTWLPYVDNVQRVSGSCENRFAVILKQLESDKSVTAKDFGSVVGKFTHDMGNWWGQTTKPISDTVDDFKAGYNSSRN